MNHALYLADEPLDELKRKVGAYHTALDFLFPHVARSIRECLDVTVVKSHSPI